MDKAGVLITVNLNTGRKAKILYEALKPEVKSSSSLRSKVEIRVQGKSLVMNFHASQITALRAAVNSFCRWFSQVEKLIGIMEEYHNIRAWRAEEKHSRKSGSAIAKRYKRVSLI